MYSFVAFALGALKAKRSPSPEKNRLLGGGSPERSFPPPASTVYGRRVYADAVCHRLQGMRPFHTPETSVVKLLRDLRSTLDQPKNQKGSLVSTAFDGVKRTPEGLYRISLDNGQEVTRTVAEAELHILLQANDRLLEAEGTPPSKSPDRALPSAIPEPSRTGRMPFRHTHPVRPEPAMHFPACPVGASPSRTPETDMPKAMEELPTFSPSPCTRSAPRSEEDRTEGMNAAKILNYEDHLRNPIRIYTSQAIDMAAVDERLKSSHVLKNIAGSSSHCWWRAAMLSAILQKKPKELECCIVDALGEEFRREAGQMARMSAAIRKEGIHTILTGFKLEYLQTDMAESSRLKLPYVNVTEEKGAGEEVCQRVASALLSKCGVPENELIGMVFGNQMGNVEHIAAILRQLGSEAIVFTKPWGEFQEGTEVQPDFSRSLITVCAIPGGYLSRVEQDGDKTRCTENLLREMPPIPVLIHRGAHFDVAIPDVQVHLCALRYNLTPPK